MDPQHALALLDDQRHLHLTAAEDGKDHPLRGFSLDAETWQALKAHLLDGGGSANAARLRVAALEALVADDQATFWPTLAHLLKSHWRTHGHVQPTGDGITKHGVLSAPPPAI